MAQEEVPKTRNKLAVILTALVLVIFVISLALVFILRSESFKQYALRKIIVAAEQATGGKTEIHGLDFSLSTLTARLYGISIHGTEPTGQPPLLQAEKLTVGFKIVSLLQRKIDLSDLETEHPVVHLQIDRNGQSNVPQAPLSQTNQTSSQTSVFDMAVRHVRLTNGEVNYKDKKTPLDADLYNLATDIHYELLANRYSGTLSYSNGHIRYAEYIPLSHGLTAKFTATPTQLSIQPVVLTVGSSVATLDIQLANYSHPTVDGDYNIRIHTQDFATLAPSAEPAGDILLTGKLHCPDAGSQSLLRVLSVNGDISSEAISAAASTGRIEARKLHAKLLLANGSLQAREIIVETLGGMIRADLDVRNLDATPSSQLRTTFHNISLQAAQRSLHRPELRQVTIFGIVDGKSEASWTGSIQNIKATTDLTLHGGARKAKNLNASVVNVPVDGVIHLTYDGSRSAIGFRSSTVQIPSAVLTAQGEVSDRSNLQIQTTISDLGKMVTLANALRSNAPPPPALSGNATFNATVRGSLKRPDIAGELSAQSLKVEGSDWSSVHLNFEAKPSQVAISNATLVSAHHGRANFSGTVSLQDWAYLPSNQIKATLSVQQMSIADLQQVLKANYPASGDLSAQITLGGSQNNPQGSGTVQITHGNVYGEALQGAAVTFKANGNSIESSMKISAAAGSANADLTFAPKTRAYTLRLEAPGIVLQKLHFVEAKNLPLSGTVTASASGNGTLDNPQLTAAVQVPKLTVRDKSISAINAKLEVADRKAGFNLSSQVVDSSVQAHGQVNLTGDYDTDAAIDTTSVPLDVLLATYVPSLPAGFKGQTEFHATLKGPLKNAAQLEAHLTIPVLNATYSASASSSPLQIGAAAPIRIDYARSVITVQPSDIRGTDSSLHFQGSIPLAGTAAPTFTAQGSVDLKVAEVFLPDTKSSGTISLDIRASGTPQNPNINGQVRLQDVAVLQSGAPLGVEKLNGSFDIADDRINLTDLSGQVGGGNLTAGGSIRYKPGMQFNVALQAHSIRLRYPDGLRSILDGNLAFTGTKDSSVLNGRVLIDSVSFTPEFDLAKFSDQFSSNTATPAQPGFGDTVNLAIAVQSQENLSATSSQISIAGRVNLNVGGTVSNPVITGRTDLTSGELFYRNVRYQLQRGIITFSDPNQTAPVLNVAVSSTVEQYNLTLNLRGPFDQLTTSYVSDPPLATADIINLLATGQTTQQSAGSQSTDSIIASQAASQFSGSVQKLAGLSSLQIDPLIGGGNQNPSARIAVQQRVTKNFLFTFSTDVSQPGSEIVEGDYQINKRWSVSVARQEAGGVSAEGRFHTRF